jgi:hypothetical protein
LDKSVKIELKIGSILIILTPLSRKSIISS